ncbi:hypothetical protein [Labilibacter marinus]|uniref:hypothetical protein n=1 Tax=Labilibacter marinus TaxID=1477105 RepID=UPI00082B769B|nr:hypothetical protein [Labilibacter marinus]
MFWNKLKKNKAFAKIELTDLGLQVSYYDEITKVFWDEIIILKAFKIDNLVVDDICLEIQTDNKVVVVSEEFEGWSELLIKILDKFPMISKDWESNIAFPPFERKEMELYNASRE